MTDLAPLAAHFDTLTTLQRRRARLPHRRRALHARIDTEIEATTTQIDPATFQRRLEPLASWVPRRPMAREELPIFQEDEQRILAVSGAPSWWIPTARELGMGPAQARRPLGPAPVDLDEALGLLCTLHLLPALDRLPWSRRRARRHQIRLRARQLFAGIGLTLANLEARRPDTRFWSLTAGTRRIHRATAELHRLVNP